MKKCHNCEMENLDEAIFCTGCGASFEPESEDVEVTVGIDEEVKDAEAPVIREESAEEVVVETVDEASEVTTEKVEAEDAKPVTSDDGEGTKDAFVNKFKGYYEALNTKFPKWYFVPAGLVVLIVIAVVASSLMLSNPVIKTLYGVQKLFSQDKYDIAFSVETDIDPALDDLLEDIEIQLLTTTNTKEVESGMSLEISFQDKKIIDFLAVVKDDYLYLDIPEVLDDNEYYYMEIEDYMEVDEEQVENLKGYIADIDLKGFDLNGYADAIVDAADGNISMEDSTVIYTIDAETAADIIKEIFDMLEDDEETAKWVQKNGIKILTKMIEDDFEIGYFDADVAEEILEEVEDDDFVEDWLEYMEEVNDYTDYLEEELEWEFGDSEMEVVFDFGFGNKINSVATTIDNKDEDIEVTVIADMTKGFNDNSKYTDADGNDLEDIDYEEILDILEDTSDYLQDYIDDNDELKDYIEDYADDNFNIDDVDDLFDEILDEASYNFRYLF